MGVGECQDSGFCSFVFAQVRHSCALSLSTLTSPCGLMDDLCRKESQSSGRKDMFSTKLLFKGVEVDFLDRGGSSGEVTSAGGA